MRGREKAGVGYVRHLMRILAFSLSLAILTLWLCAPLMAEDKQVANEAPAQTGSSLSPTAALGSYSLKGDASHGDGYYLNHPAAKDAASSSGFSPEITIGGEMEMRYFRGGHF